MGYEGRIKELDAWMNYLETARFLRAGVRDLFEPDCEVTLLGSHSASRKINAMGKVRQAEWLIGGLQGGSGGRVEVIDALYYARSDKAQPLYKNRREFASATRDGNGPQLIARSAGLTLRLWTEGPSLSLILDGGEHFNLTRKFGWVLFLPENHREGLLSPA